jgi:hypothetical protein
MTTTGSLAAALLATLSRPAWWAMALAGFLLRGGLLLVLLPIVRLPTTAGLANELGPVLVGFVFGGPSVPFLVLVGTVAGGTVLWLVAGGLLGGWLDLAMVRETAVAEELDGVPPSLAGDAGTAHNAVRAFLVRVLAHLPTAVVLAWGAVSLVDAAYQELIRPGDPALPVPVRVALRIPAVVGLLIAAWVLGEAVGGLAVRHLAWGASLPRAMGRAVRAIARPSALATLILTNGVVAAAVLGSGVAASVAWEQLRIVLLDGGTGGELRLALIFFSLTWIAGLWLIALAATWRATAWTFEVARQLPVGPAPGPSTDAAVLAT